MAATGDALTARNMSSTPLVHAGQNSMKKSDFAVRKTGRSGRIASSVA
jgi:hypothetical protein